MEVYSLICQEIDDLEKNLTVGLKAASRDILNEYRTIVEDEHFGNFTTELSKIFSRNRKRLQHQTLFQGEEILKAKDQYLDEINRINQKAKEFNKNLSRKAKENRPMSSEKSIEKSAYSIPRQKLREIDMNSMRSVYDQTHMQLLNHYASKIQRVFRQYLAKKNKKANEKAKRKSTKESISKKQTKRNYEYPKEKVIKSQALIKGYLARKRYAKLRKFDFGFRQLSQAAFERTLKECFKKLSHYSQLRVKLHNREKNLLKFTNIKDVAFSTIDHKELKVINKLEGKFKMAEYFYSSYRKSQIFYTWVILASRRKLN